MATRIIEYAERTSIEKTLGLPVVPQSVVRQAAMTATGSSQQSPAFGTTTCMVCVQSDETIHVARGTNPTVTTDNYKIQAKGEQFFTATPGEKIAIMTGT